MSLIRYGSKIHFADNIVEHAVNAELEALGLARPMVVADRRVVDSGLFKRIRDAIPDTIDTVLFEAVPSPPTASAAMEATRTYLETGCDGLIGLGCGAAIDLAKAAGLAVSHQGPLEEYAASEGGIARIRDILPPIIAIPTTAGGGTEVGRIAQLVSDTNQRIDLVSPFLVPRVAICDPELTLGQPSKVTAGVGMDAVTHCVEAYLATAYNPPADGIALEGLKRVAANIEKAVECDRDINARRELMAAAINGALAMQKGLGGVHAASHALGGKCGCVDHGALNAILLPRVIEFNAPAVSERFLALEQAMGLRASVGLADGLDRLRERLHLPRSLSAMGVDRAAIDVAAPLAEKDHSNGTNPRRACAADYREIMHASL